MRRDAAICNRRRRDSIVRPPTGGTAAAPIAYGTAVALAQVPTTFILDRNDLVIFRKSGATDSWPAMAEQIRHALENSVR